MNHFTIIIITGYSGSGKSTALAVLEDIGYYCVDNMPVVFLPKFIELPIESNSEIQGLAFVMDLREKTFLSKYPSVFESLKTKGYDLKILFLEADEQILLQRYSQTRRHHPLSQGKNLLDNIRAEQKQMKKLRIAADSIINTSHYNVHELRSTILDIAQKSKALSPMNIHIMSFGYKYGIPHNADLIIDVRFLANPYFVHKLRDLDGETLEIKDYLLSHNETHIFLKKYGDLLDYLIPLYEKEGKAYLTIAVGCTGGRHRSVAIARFVFEHIETMGKNIEITHRDLAR